MWVRVHVYNIYIYVCCVWIHEGMSTWSYVQMSTCMYTWHYVWVHSYTWHYVWVHSYLHDHIYSCIFMYMYMYVCMYVCLGVWMHAWWAYLTMPVPSCTASVSVSLFVSACFFFASAILLKVSEGKERNEKERKAKQRDGMGTSVFCIVYTTRYVSCKVQY